MGYFGRAITATGQSRWTTCSASDTTFSITAAFNGAGADDDLSVSISSASLSNYGSYDISKKIVETACERGTIPSLIGDTITSLPVEGLRFHYWLADQTMLLQSKTGPLSSRDLRNKGYLQA